MEASESAPDAEGPGALESSSAPQVRPFVRRNGFQRPWHWMQIASWAVFALLFVGFHVALGAVLEGFMLWVVFILHAALALLTMVSAGNTVRTDPVAAKGEARPGDSSFCNLCRRHVRRASKHCRTCNKCVSRFDHHCFWLNTCIGERNYGSFFSLLLSSALLLALQFLTSVVAMTLYLRGEEGSLAGGLVAVYACLALACLAGVLNLLVFHVRLSRRDQTTYEFLVEKAHARRLQERQRAEAVQLQRQQAAGVTLPESTTPSSARSPAGAAPREVCCQNGHGRRPRRSQVSAQLLAASGVVTASSSFSGASVSAGSSRSAGDVQLT